MHFVLVNQCFHPDTASTGQILHDFASYLTSPEGGGHRVTVVTSRQRYGTDQLLEVGDETLPPTAPGGGEMVIRRLRGTRFGKKTLPGRVADFVSFYALAFRELLRHRDADAWLVLTSPPMIGVVAELAASLPGRRRLTGRVVHWVMDLYPEATHAHGMLRPTHPLYRVCRRAMGKAFARSAGLVALGDDMRDLICQSHPRLDAAKVIVVHPWADGRALRPVDRASNPLAAELGLDRTFNLVYSGNLGLAHDLETFLGAIERTANNDPTGVRWVFIGSGKRYEQLSTWQSQRNFPHVRLLPFMPREKLSLSLGLADVHLLSQLPAFTGVVVPSKLFGIMAAGRPALMVGPDDCECARVIRRHDIGRVVPVGDVDGLLAAVNALRVPGVADAMGRRARAAFEAEDDRPVGCRHIAALLAAAAGPRS